MIGKKIVPAALVRVGNNPLETETLVGLCSAVPLGSKKAD
jgi:hypothetical protein